MSIQSAKIKSKFLLVKFLLVAVILTAIVVLLVVLRAKNFKVADFGAVGDGKTDDGPAIRKAMAAAIAAGPGSKVVFEKKKYRLGKYEKNYHFLLEKVSGITLEGNGAELINNPYNCIFDLNNSSNVTVRGFFFDCDPLPFTQGRITKVEPGKGVFFLQIQKGYDNPVKVYQEIGKKKPRWGWGVCMDPKLRKRKPGAVMHFFIKDVTEVSSGKNLLRVQLDPRSSKNANEIKKGDRFVITLKYGGHGASIRVHQSTECRLENNVIYTVKYGMTHALTDNRGRVYVKGVKITFKPGSDRLISTPKDGFHCKHNAIGPVIEDCLFEGLLDDSINISVCPYWVKKDMGHNKYLIAELAFSPRKGDTLMAYTPSTGLVTRGLKVLAVEPKDRPAGYRRGYFNVITLNKPIPHLKLHQGGNLFPGGAGKLKFTGLYNIDASGKDYIIRGNTFLAQRRHAVLARSSGGLIEGNTIDGVGGNGVRLNNEIRSFYEGPFPSKTVIRNNTFRNTFLASIQVYIKGKNVWADKIIIENNTISGWFDNPRDKGPAAAINLSNVSDCIIRGNTIETGKGDPGRSSVVLIKNSRGLLIENNVIKDERPELNAVFDVYEGVDRTSLVMKNNKYKKPKAASGE